MVDPLNNAPSEPGRGALWVVATPIGCLEDITFRAVRVLREVDTILCEDTRRTRALCAHYEIRTTCKSFHAHTADREVDRVLDQLRNGASFALVSDAGTPLISDPGVRLVAGAQDGGVTVCAVPGPSAVPTALSICGLRCDTFRFMGFVPRSAGARRRLFSEAASDASAWVLFESATRLPSTLEALAESVGARRIAVCREMTKRYEEVIRGTSSEVRAAINLRTDELKGRLRGEITLVIEAQRSPASGVVDEKEHARELVRQGLSLKDASRQLAKATRLSGSEAYRLLVALRSEDGGTPIDG